MRQRGLRFSAIDQAASTNRYAAYPLAVNVAGERPTEPVPPAAHGLVADIDAAFVQQIFQSSSNSARI
jgi:hypothetical protein